MPYRRDRADERRDVDAGGVGRGRRGSRLEGEDAAALFRLRWSLDDAGPGSLAVRVRGGTGRGQLDAGRVRRGESEPVCSQCAVSGRESHSPNSQSRVGERRGSGGRPGGRRQAQAMSGKGRGDTGPSPDAGDAGTVDRIHATARWMGSTHHGSSRSGFALPGPFGGRGSGDEHEGAGRGMRLADRRPGPREARFFTA